MPETGGPHLNYKKKYYKEFNKLNAIKQQRGFRKMNLRSTSSSVSYLVPGSLVQPFVYHADSEKVSIIMRQMRLGESSLEVNLVKIASKA